jgi:predicted metal-binding membrane protein
VEAAVGAAARDHSSADIGVAAAPHRWRAGAIVLGGLGTATVLAWVYVAAATGAFVGHAPSHAMSRGLELGFAVSMWTVMMAGMMLPSAAPMVVTFDAVSRRRDGHLARAAIFVGAYLVVWAGFSVLGAAAQLGLRSARLLSTAGVAAPWLAGALLLGAGIYQLSPLKNACLRRCRTPLGFLLAEWRPGAGGAAVMGLRHGVECVVCCWGIMALMFVFGTMDLRWMAALTLLMLVEKVLPGGDRIGRAAGVACLAWGMWMMVLAIA